MANISRIKPKRAFGRDLAEIIERRGYPLSPVEEMLRDACREGVIAEVGTKRPTAKTEDNTIDARVLRFFILGGDDNNPVHETGVLLTGAWIEGILDLQNAETDRNIGCLRCHFAGDIILQDALVSGLYLDGSCIAALQADRMQASASVHLRDGFEARGEVRLHGADIGGSLQCRGGTFLHAGRDALGCDRAKIKGSVFLDQGFEARGEVRLYGAEIGGDLSCESGQFLGKFGSSLDLERATVAGNCFCRSGPGAADLDARQLKPTVIAGTLDLSSALVGTLVDDAQCWPGAGKLAIDGFQYQSFAGHAPVGAQQRARWLGLQPARFLGADFRPQPWRQCIKVLRETGHTEEARTLAVIFEQQRRKAGVYAGLGGVLHDLYGVLAGYGYRPMRLAWWVVGVWFACAFIYSQAAVHDVMAPANPLVFEHQSNAHCRLRAGDKTSWTNADTCNSPNEYTTFQPAAYSLDLILPLVDLQQDKDWAPMVTRPITPDPRGPSQAWPFGHFVRIVMWFEILFGWVASLLFVAILSGLIKKAGDE